MFKFLKLISSVRYFINSSFFSKFRTHSCALFILNIPAPFVLCPPNLKSPLFIPFIAFINISLFFSASLISSEKSLNLKLNLCPSSKYSLSKKALSAFIPNLLFILTLGLNSISLLF